MYIYIYYMEFATYFIMAVLEIRWLNTMLFKIRKTNREKRTQTDKYNEIRIGINSPTSKWIYN